MPTDTREPVKPEPPKGCVFAKAPDGETQIVVKAPRGPGPWFRVHHAWTATGQHGYGVKTVKAATPEEAVQKFAEEVAPQEARNKKWLDAFAQQCRTVKLPEPAAPAPAAV
jgi:hypothetical protein